MQQRVLIASGLSHLMRMGESTFNSIVFFMLQSNKFTLSRSLCVFFYEDHSHERSFHCSSLLMLWVMLHMYKADPVVHCRFAFVGDTSCTVQF